MTPQQLSGIALVTGGSRGIGRAIAGRLAEDGMKVAIAARSSDDVKQAANEIDGIPLVLDVTDRDAVSSAIASVEEHHGPVEFAVNNAGMAETAAPIWEQSLDDWWKVIEVNLYGPVNIMRAVMPSMVQRGAGRVVNVSSELAHTRVEDAPTFSAYMSSKAALTRLSEAVACDAAPHGVKVFSIRPGAVDTGLTERMVDTWGRDSPNIPRSFNEPEEAAALVSMIARGELDELSGRHIDLAREDWESLPERAGDIVRDDLLALRLRR